MGFTLSGNNSGGYYGVALGAGGTPVKNGVVRNGAIRYFGAGLHASACQSFRFEQITIYSNTSSGINLSGSSSKVCANNVIRDCIITGNGYCGFDLRYLAQSGSGVQCEGNLITDCTLSRNEMRGIWLSGVYGNRVEGNHLYGQLGANSYGIQSSGGSRNLIFRNTCVGQTNNFSLSSSDIYGPIMTASGALSTTNGAAGLSPWANFSR